MLGKSGLKHTVRFYKTYKAERANTGQACSLHLRHKTSQISVLFGPQTPQTLTPQHFANTSAAYCGSHIPTGHDGRPGILLSACCHILIDERWSRRLRKNLFDHESEMRSPGVRRYAIYIKRRINVKPSSKTFALTSVNISIGIFIRPFRPPCLPRTLFRGSKLVAARRTRFFLEACGSSATYGGSPATDTV